MIVRCIVPNCSSSRLKITSHRFPKNSLKAEQWKRAINNPDIDNMDSILLNKRYHVCTLHFTPEDYLVRTTRPTLREGAVPSLNLPPKDEQANPVARTSIDLIDCDKQLLFSNYTPTGKDAVLAKPMDFAGDHGEISLVPRYASNRSDSSLLGFKRSYNSAEDVDDSISPEQPKKIKISTSETHRAVSMPRIKYYRQKMLSLKARAISVRNRKMPFEKRLLDALQLLREKDEAYLLLRDRLTPARARIFASRLRSIAAKGAAARDRDFDGKELAMALPLLKAAGRGYHLLAAVFQLPSARALRNASSSVVMDTGLDRPLFQRLADRVKTFADRRDRLAILSWGTMSLNPSVRYDARIDKIIGFEDCDSRRTRNLADYALVFVVRSVRDKWSWPLSFHFCASCTRSQRLAEILEDHVAVLQRAGISVVAMICDQTPANVAAIRKLRAAAGQRRSPSDDDDDYPIDIHGERIIPLFDACCLLKSLRNNLMTSHLEFEPNVRDGKRHLAKWSHLETYYYLLGRLFNNSEEAARISHHHVIRRCVDKCDSRRAAEIFNEDTALFLASLAAQECTLGDVKMPRNAEDTSKMLGFIGNLFDSMNGHPSDSDSGKWCCAVSLTSGHRQYWTSADEKLSGMRFVDRNSAEPVDVPCLANWRKTLRGLLLLWERLLVTEKLERFYPRIVSLDGLRKFVDAVHNHCRPRSDPSCEQFAETYKLLLIDGEEQTGKTYQLRRANSVIHERDTLLSLDNVLKKSLPRGSRAQAVEDLPSMSDPDMKFILRTFNSRSNSVYTANAVACKLLNIIRDCETCRSCVLAEVIGSRGDSEGGDRDASTTFHYLSVGFLRTFANCDGILRRVLPAICFRDELRRRLRQNLDIMEDMKWMRCPRHASFAKASLIDLLISLHVHSFCHLVNRILSGKVVKYSGCINRIFKQAWRYRLKRQYRRNEYLNRYLCT